MWSNLYDNLYKVKFKVIKAWMSHHIVYIKNSSKDGAHIFVAN